MDKSDLERLDIIQRKLYEIREWIRCKAAGLVPKWDDQIKELRIIEEVIRHIRFKHETGYEGKGEGK